MRSELTYYCENTNNPHMECPWDTCPRCTLTRRVKELEGAAEEGQRCESCGCHMYLTTKCGECEEAEDG